MLLNVAAKRSGGDDAAHSPPLFALRLVFSLSAVPAVPAPA
jgi:hypothetical protein